ncbi:MAG TPA: calcium-binding protein [Microvirga sp.]
MALQSIRLRTAGEYGGEGLDISTNNQSTIIDLSGSDATGLTLNRLNNDPVLGFQYNYQNNVQPWQTGQIPAYFMGGNPLRGNDAIQGGDGNDTFFGGAGNDRLDGNGGNNFLVGDSLFGQGFGGGANLVANGSFEEFVFNPPFNGEFYSVPTPNGLANWNSNAAPDDVVELVTSAHGRGTPTAGNVWLDMDSSAGNVTIKQMIGGLVTGGLYVLRFDANESDAATSGAGDSMQVNFGSLNQNVDPQSGTAFKGYEYLTVATGVTTELRFEGLGSPDFQGVGLDNVRLYDLSDAEGGMGDGNDRLTGLGGNDTQIGGGGNDVLSGNGGSNTQYGGAGTDLITSNGGAGSIQAGGRGGDTIYGSDGADTVGGGRDNDFIRSNNGNDLVSDGDGRDFVDAGGGNDRILLGAGDDQGVSVQALFENGNPNTQVTQGGEVQMAGFYGGSGADTFVINGAFGNDTIYDFRLSEGDTLQFNDDGTPGSIVGSSVNGADLVLQIDSDGVGGADSTLTLFQYVYNNGLSAVATSTSMTADDGFFLI